MAEGKILYRDIFLDNFPLAAYIGFFYRTITFGDMNAFRLTGTIEALVLTWLLYKHEFSQSKNTFISLLATGTFCCSFLFLRTATDQSAVFTALLFFFIGYMYWEKKSFVVSGVLIALSVLTKAYMFPIGLALFFATFIQHRKKLPMFTIAGFVTGLIVLLPTILFAFPQFIAQTFQYGMVRGVIEDKWYIIDLFKYDWIIVILLISGWFVRKRSLAVWLMSIFAPLFFVFYKDFYYVYFSMIVVIAALIAGVWLRYLLQSKYGKYSSIGYAVILFLMFTYNALFLISYAHDTRILPEVDKLYNVIKKEHPDAIYAYAPIANGLSYVTGIPPYKNYVDITGNQFKSGILDKTKMTEEVVNSRTLIIITAIKQGTQLMPETVIVDPNVIEKSNCKSIYEQPLTRYKGIDFKYLIVIKCYK
jgi:hypothetical protein